MQDSVKEKLDKFASLANFSMPHPLDMGRFWEFVIEAFRVEDKHIAHEAFEDEIKKHHSDEEIIDELFGKYENGIELLSKAEELGFLS